MEDNEKPIPVFPYKIAYDLEETDNPYVPSNPSSLLAELLNELMDEAYRPTKKTPERIQRAIAKFPQQPQFYNFLATAYALLDRKTKALEVNRKAYAKFPEYLYARVALALHETQEGKFEKALHYLGEDLRLEELYPKRKSFHVTEVVNYYKAVGIYHADRGEFDLAEDTSYLMKQVDRDSQQAEFISKYILSKRIQKTKENLDQLSADNIELEDRDFHYEHQTDTPPEFHHAEIQWLYEYDFRIPADKVQALLALPRESLIQDLEAVLEDGIHRFDYWNEQEWERSSQSFLGHAIMLLGALRATESLPAILNQLRQGYEYNEFWFGEWDDDIFTTPLYNLANGQPEVLKNFAMEPLIEAHYKYQAAKPIPLMALLQPDRREEVMAWYEEVIRYFLDHEAEEDLLDTTFLAYLIDDAAQAGLTELKPLAKEVFDRDLASLDMMGDWEEAQMYFDKPNPEEKLNWYFEDASKQYAHLTDALNRIEKMEREAEERRARRLRLQEFERANRTFPANDQPTRVEKIGRNERVSVRYADGTVKKDVKYKTVEQDVELGKATLM